LDAVEDGFEGLDGKERRRVPLLVQVKMLENRFENGSEN
jgi:hypothetical protein